MIYVISCMSVIFNFLLLMWWGYAEGNIDNLIHYLNINYPEAIEGIRRDYVIKIGHYKLGGKENLDRNETREEIDD